MKLVLEVIFALHVLLAIFSFFKIRNSKKKVEFIYFVTFPIGVWVWEDLLVISGLHMFISLLTLYLNDLRVGLLSLLVFWSIRNMGEAIYYMLQQFIQPTFPPHYIHNHFFLFRKFFGNISDQKCFILLQVSFQVSFAISLILLALLLLNWNSVPTTF